MKKYLVLALIVLLFFCSKVFAAGLYKANEFVNPRQNIPANKVSTKVSPVDDSDFQIGTQIFFRWQKYTANGGTNVNNFDIDRAYLDFKKKIPGDPLARVTLDAARPNSDTKQNLYNFLKYAYVEMPLGSWSFLPATVAAKIGLQQTMWIDWDDKILGLRWIAKSLLDNEGVMNSADFGVGASGKFQFGKMPEIEYQATVLNGSGFATQETNSSKDFGLRLNSTFINNKLGKLVLGIYGNLKDINSQNLGGSNQQYGATLGWQSSSSVLYLEGLTGSNNNKNISGYSLGAKYEFLPGITIFCRADNYNPDTSLTTKVIDRLFYGLIFTVNPAVQVSLDMQNVTGGSSASTSAGKTTSAFYFHTVITI